VAPMSAFDRLGKHQNTFVVDERDFRIFDGLNSVGGIGLLLYPYHFHAFPYCGICYKLCFIICRYDIKMFDIGREFLNCFVTFYALYFIGIWIDRVQIEPILAQFLKTEPPNFLVLREAPAIAIFRGAKNFWISFKVAILQYLLSGYRN
jgi:hypothetical protein